MIHYAWGGEFVKKIGRNWDMVGKFGGIFSAPHLVFSQDGSRSEVALVCDMPRSTL